MAISQRKYKSGKVVWGYAFDAPGSGRSNRQQITKGGFKKRSEALAAEAVRRVAAKQEHTARVLNQNATTGVPKTLTELLEAFFSQHGKRLAPKTLERYRQMVSYISSDLLATTITGVTAFELTREWNRLIERGGKVRKTKAERPLSPATVRKIAGMISSAFSRAVAWGFAEKNPVSASSMPVIRRNSGVVLTTLQQNLIINSVGEDLSAFLLLAAATGARRGELLALRWSDLNGEKLLIDESLCQTKAGLEFKEPKNGKPRQITVPESAVAVLSKHQQRQAVFRKQYGPDYHASDLIFCNPDGSPLKPDSVSAKVSGLIARLNLPPGTSLHTFRHTHGSHLLAAGMPLPAVSARLGHSSVYVTATIYAHQLPDSDVEAARKWEQFQQQSVGHTAKAAVM